MTTIVGTLRKMTFVNDEVYYVQHLHGGVYNITKKLSLDPELDSYLDKENLEWSVLDWNYLADRKEERYRVSGIFKVTE